MQAGIVGVVSKSKATSIRLYNGRSHYNEWQFVYIPRQQTPGAPGASQRGGPGQPQIPGINGRGRGDGRGGPPNLPPGGRGPAPGGRGPGIQPFSPGGFGQPMPQPRPPGD